MTVASTTTESSGFTAFVLAGLRVAAARMRVTVNEIDVIGVALTGGFIDTDTAIAWAADIGVLDLIPTSSAITAVST